MTAKPPATLKIIRRGEDLDEIHLIDTEGRILILHAHGIHDDEKARVREVVLRLIRDALPPDLTAFHGEDKRPSREAAARRSTRTGTGTR